MKIYLLSQVAPLLQLAIAALLGMLLGVERSIAGKVAGMRTYGLVSMGACLFVVVSIAVAQSVAAFWPIDPLRVLEGVITGVGFIGAGMILFRESSLQGLTTAAGLWIAAGVGVTVGYGLYVIALFATLLTLFIFTAVWFLEHKILRIVGKEEEKVV
jgi:putative Mg2+ transporter-C (MgtC) family protein